MASSSTYLDLDLAHIGRLEKLERVVRWRNVGIFTKLLTMILESPLPAAGPLGTAPFAATLAPFVPFWIPPDGAAAVVLVPFGARRPRPPRRPAVLRRVLRISSKDLSSFPDILR